MSADAHDPIEAAADRLWSTIAEQHGEIIELTAAELWDAQHGEDDWFDDGADLEPDEQTKRAAEKENLAIEVTGRIARRTALKLIKPFESFYVGIARCPEHGLHGQRDECFVCGGAVEYELMLRIETST